MNEQLIWNADGQLIWKVDTFLWLSRGNLKTQTEREIIAAPDKALKTTLHATKYWKQKQIGNADSASNMTRDNRPREISVPSIGERKIYILSDVLECVLNCTLPYT